MILFMYTASRWDINRYCQVYKIQWLHDGYTVEGSASGQVTRFRIVYQPYEPRNIVHQLGDIKVHFLITTVPSTTTTTTTTTIEDTNWLRLYLDTVWYCKGWVASRFEHCYNLKIILQQIYNSYIFKKFLYSKLCLLVCLQRYFNTHMFVMHLTLIRYSLHWRNWQYFGLGFRPSFNPWNPGS